MLTLLLPTERESFLHQIINTHFYFLFCFGVEFSTHPATHLYANVSIYLRATTTPHPSVSSSLDNSLPYSYASLYETLRRTTSALSHIEADITHSLTISLSHTLIPLPLPLS